MYENILGKRIKYIELHNFLCKLETGQIVSMLHSDGYNLMSAIEKEGEAEWNGIILDKNKLNKLLQEEEGELSALQLKHTNYGPEAAINFESGNALKVSLKNEEQFAQIYDYFIQIKS